MSSIRARLAVVTPILGGAARTRTVDEVDVIRVPTIRGHLRFWWRALNGDGHDPGDLYAMERAIWGGSGGADEVGGRSSVEVCVRVIKAGEIDREEVRPYPMRGMPATPGAYALWPARGTSQGEPPAPRRKAGTVFELDLRCPEEFKDQVLDALRAWVLFGGYGSRTRRGVGSLSVDDGAGLLPASATRAGIDEVFGRDVFKRQQGIGLSNTAFLSGAALAIGKVTGDAQDAWTTALSWLSEFRQGQPPSDRLSVEGPRYARERGDDRRPGRSNWPEADKVRQLAGRGPYPHPPRHNAKPAWPRAGFGLPIIAQFQKKDRSTNQYYSLREPENFELRWRRAREEHDRLASPLIVKALPLAHGRFAPCALWLYRGYPQGEVALRDNDRRSRESGAPFDLLVAPGDRPQFDWLAVDPALPPGMRLRTAFLNWLASAKNVEVFG